MCVCSVLSECRHSSVHPKTLWWMGSRASIDFLIFDKVIQTNVAPHAGAWIETPSSSSCLITDAGRRRGNAIRLAAPQRIGKLRPPGRNVVVGRAVAFARMACHPRNVGTAACSQVSVHTRQQDAGTWSDRLEYPHEFDLHRLAVPANGVAQPAGRAPADNHNVVRRLKRKPPPIWRTATINDAASASEIMRLPFCARRRPQDYSTPTKVPPDRARDQIVGTVTVCRWAA